MFWEEPPDRPPGQHPPGIVIGEVGGDASPVDRLGHEPAGIAVIDGGARIGACLLDRFAEAVPYIGGDEASRIGVAHKPVPRIEPVIDLGIALIGFADEPVQRIIGEGIEIAPRIGDGLEIVHLVIAEGRGLRGSTDRSEKPPQFVECLGLAQRDRVPLGDARFLDRIERRLGRPARPQKRGPKPKDDGENRSVRREKGELMSCHRNIRSRRGPPSAGR
jgi:hypothetical protein